MAGQSSFWLRMSDDVDRPRDRHAPETDGGSSYDRLDVSEQARVRAEWSVRMDELREGLDFALEFAAEGRAWVELDERGEVVELHRRG